jgi:hypothetical protein
MQKLGVPVSNLTKTRTYKPLLDDLKKKEDIVIQQFNIDFKNLFFIPFQWKIKIPFTIYIRNTKSHIEDKIMANPDFAEILKNRMLMQNEQYKVKYVKMINMIKMAIDKKDYEDILFVTFKKRYFYPYLSWHATAQKYIKINTDTFDIFYFENDQLPWIKLDCHFLFDMDKYIIKYMNEYGDGFIEQNLLNIKDFFIKFNQPFPTIITLFFAEKFRQQILEMIAFKLVQSKNSYWKELCVRLMGRQESAFLALRKQIELSWVDNLVLRFNFTFMGKQSLKIMNSHGKKIRMKQFNSLFNNVKKKTFNKKKPKKKKKEESKTETARKKMLLTSKYGRKTRVKKVGR